MSQAGWPGPKVCDSWHYSGFIT